MDATTTRVLSCPRCGAVATVQLGWQRETAWTADVQRYRCPNTCRVRPAAILQALGFDQPRRPKR